MVPPTPEEPLAGKSSRRSLEFDEDETQDPNEDVPSPDATVDTNEEFAAVAGGGLGRKDTYGPPPGATLDIEESEMPLSQDLFDTCQPHAPKVLNTIQL